MLRLARVVDVHPEDNSVDLVMLDDGSRYVAVQVLAIGASGNTGLVDLPLPNQTSNKWGLAEATERDVRAVVSMVTGKTMGTPIPIVLGLLYPQVNGMLFDDVNRRIHRHASDFYTSVDDAGNVEAFHPSGTYLRIGSSPAHEDLTGQDFDHRWAIKRNTNSAPNLCITVKNAGSQVARINIDPDGNIDLTHTGNLTWQTDGNATVNIDGNAAVTIGGNATVDVDGTTHVTSGGAATIEAPSVTLDTPATHCTGNLVVDGNLDANGSHLRHNGTNVGDDHEHTLVQSGSSNSGPPA